MAVAFGDAEVCTVTNTLGARTPFGSNVAATPIDVSTGDFPVSILFGFVGSAGVTTLESSATGPNPPAGFDVDGAYYHLESTAEFAAAEVCFPYTGTPPSIVHWVAGTPEILLDDAPHEHTGLRRGATRSRRSPSPGRPAVTTPTRRT